MSPKSVVAQHPERVTVNAMRLSAVIVGALFRFKDQSSA